MEEKELDYVISLIEYDLGIESVTDECIKGIYELARSGNLKANLWLNKMIIEYKIPLGVQDLAQRNDEDIDELVGTIRFYSGIHYKPGMWSFSFEISKITHIFTELKKRYSREYTNQQLLILTAVIVARFWFLAGNYEKIACVPQFLCDVFLGEFEYNEIHYNLFDYPEIKTTFEDNVDVLTRLCFGLFIIYREQICHINDSTLVIAPIYGYSAIERIVEKEVLDDSFPLAVMCSKDMIDGFFANEGNNISWLNGYRDNIFFLNQKYRGKKGGGLENEFKSVVASFNFNLYSVLYDFVFAKEFNVDLNDLYNNEMVVRNLLSICYQYLESKGINAGNANEWENLPIKFFCDETVMGVCIGLADYQLSSLSKYVCFVFDDNDRAYYSADFVEGDIQFLVRYKNDNGICINTLETISADSSMEEFFQFVSKHFKKNHESN